jgi:UDP-galactopyranose mutase
VPIPINQTTINRLYGLDLDEQGARKFLEEVREPRSDIRTSEDVVLDAVGRDLYEKFFRNYTRKQWGLDPSELNAAVTARIPVRYNADDRYFSDEFQAMPEAGYTRLFENLLDHPNIRVELGVDYLAARDRFPAKHTVFTGPIDAFYGYRFGRLPYRSLRFQHEHLPGTRQFQPVAVVNYPNEQAFTRITEFKHLTGQDHPGTSIVREYPTSEGDPYYPVPRPENEALYQRYKTLASKEKGVSFVGRLAQYRYYNMDQVVGAALTLSEKLLGRKRD